MDKWLASSCLQKSIRRGYTDTALRMGEWFLTNDKAYILRRMEVILSEDIGIGNPALVYRYLAATGKAREASLLELIRESCESPKDRNAAELSQAIENHSSFEIYRQQYGTFDDHALISIIYDDALSIYQRAIAAWHIAGNKAYPSERIISTRTGLDTLLEALANIGVPEVILHLTATATRKRLYGMGLGLAFSYLLARQDAPVVAQERPRNQEVIGGIPACAFDKHTRRGKQSIRQFAYTCLQVREVLENIVPQDQWPRYVGLAVFHVESENVSRRLTYCGWQEPLRLSTEGHLCTESFSTGHLNTLLAVVENNLSRLNKIRNDNGQFLPKEGDYFQ